MNQTLINDLVIFVVPGGVGLMFRFLIGKGKRGFLLSVVSVLAAGALWAYVYNIVTWGNEGYGIRAMMMTCFAVGSVLAEVYFVLRCLCQRRMKEDAKGKVTRMAGLGTLLVWVVVAVGLAAGRVYHDNNRGAVSADLILDYGTDTSYSQEEIDTAAEEVKKYFKKHHEEHILQSLRCSGDQSERAQRDYAADQGVEFSGSCLYDIDNVVNGVRFPDIVEEWSWLLVREDGGSWQVVDAEPKYE